MTVRPKPPHLRLWALGFSRSAAATSSGKIQFVAVDPGPALTDVRAELHLGVRRGPIVGTATAAAIDHGGHAIMTLRLTAPVPLRATRYVLVLKARDATGVERARRKVIQLQ